MNFEEFITSDEPENSELMEPAELEVQKAVVESLAAEKVEQDEQIAFLKKENEELKKENEELKIALEKIKLTNFGSDAKVQKLQKQVETIRQALIGYGDVLAKNTEEKASNQVALLDRDVEIEDRFPGETRDHVIEVIREARDAAERDGRIRKAQILEGVLVANEPVGELSKRRAELEELFHDSGNILSGSVLAELQKNGISHKKGEEYLLPDEILKRTY